MSNTIDDGQDRHGTQLLFRFLVPDRDYIAVYTIPEMEDAVSPLVVGHRLDDIYVNLAYHSDENQDELWDIILAFDHGILQLIPWIGSTIKLRFFSKDEYNYETIITRHNGIDSLYYKIKESPTDVVIHHVVNDAKAIETNEYYETSVVERWDGSLENCSCTYRREPTALLFMMSNSKEVAFLTGDGEEMWIRVQDAIT